MSDPMRRFARPSIRDIKKHLRRQTLCFYQVIEGNETDVIKLIPCDEILVIGLLKRGRGK